MYIWEKLCVIAGNENKIICGYAACRQRHSVLVFDNHEIDVISEEPLKKTVEPQQLLQQLKDITLMATLIHKPRVGSQD